MEQRKLRVRGGKARNVGWCATLAILVGVLSAPTDMDAGINPSSPTRQSRGNKSTSKDLPNFSEATGTLYRGGQPTKNGFRILAKRGVNIVVDLRGSRESERKIVTRLGMQYVALPWRCFMPKDIVFAQFLTLVRKNPGKKIFVHCRMGDDRTAMMIASYRMAEEGWSAERAEKEMERNGFSFAHKRLICPTLDSYEESFPHRFKTSPAFRGLR